MFNQQPGPEKKNVFKLPQQQFIKYSDQHVLTSMLVEAQSCNVLATIFKVPAP